MIPGNLSQSPRNVVRTNGVAVPTSPGKVPRSVSAGIAYGTIEIAPKGGTIYFKKGGVTAPTLTASDFDESQAIGVGPLVVRLFGDANLWWVAAGGGVTADLVETE